MIASQGSGEYCLGFLPYSTIELSCGDLDEDLEKFSIWIEHDRGLKITSLEQLRGVLAKFKLIMDQIGVELIIESSELIFPSPSI